jgi:hypothetical protein
LFFFHTLAAEVIRSNNIAQTTVAALLRLVAASGDSAEAWHATTFANSAIGVTEVLDIAIGGEAKRKKEK